MHLFVRRYLSAAKVDDELVMTGRVIKEGRTLAFLEGDIVRKADNKLLVKGTHTKFL